MVIFCYISIKYMFLLWGYREFYQFRLRDSLMVSYCNLLFLTSWSYREKSCHQPRELLKSQSWKASLFLQLRTLYITSEKCIEFEQFWSWGSCFLRQLRHLYVERIVRNKLTNLLQKMIYAQEILPTAEMIQNLYNSITRKCHETPRDLMAFSYYFVSTSAPFSVISTIYSI